MKLNAPLITPSVSPPPPPSRPLVKKQKTASTPGRTVQCSVASSDSRSQTPVDINQERDASRLRLLDVWAGLAKRYSRHMDEDDLVDIRTGEITKDNGVWRSAPALEFGALAAPEDEGSVAEDDEEGYDQDELDAFADSDCDGSDFAEGDSNGKFVSTSTLLDAADAEDLQKFLEAERIRREQWGSDVDDEELEETQKNERRVLMAGQPRKSGGNQEDGVETDEESCLEDSSSPIRGEYLDDPELVEQSSGDELDNWTVDESNAIRVVAKKEDSKTENDIESPPAPTVSQNKTGAQTDLSTGQRSRSITRQKFQPLHTPPRSSSGSASSPIVRDFAFSHSPHTAAPLRDRISMETPKNKLVDKFLPIPDTTDLSPMRLTSKRPSVPSRDNAPGGSSRNQTPQKRGTLVSGTPLSLKRKRVPSDSIHLMPEADFDEEFLDSQLPSSSHPSTSYRRTTTKRQSPFTPGSPSASCSDYDSDSSPAEKLQYKNRPLRSRLSAISRPHGPGSHMPPSYPSRNNDVFMPIPDPRAQFIIAQALQQLSALVGMPWQPPSLHSDDSGLHTPSRRHHMQPPGYLYATPNRQPHIDSNFSQATFPPESPEYDDSVQAHSSSPKRRALVHRSHSRGRRVSFRVDDNSPSKRSQPNPEFEESKFLLHQEEWSSEDVSEYEQDKPPVEPRYVRGQTPGPPNSHPSRRRART